MKIPADDAERIVSQQKKQMRTEMRNRLASLDLREIQRADEQILQKLIRLTFELQPKTVFCFVSKAQEINTLPFLQFILDGGRQLCVPLCVGAGVMEARRIRSLGELKKGFYGLMEPEQSAPLVRPEEIDLAVIPCLSCSRDGRRLGYGGGFYDRFYEACPDIPSVMVCRSAMMREDIPAAAYDHMFPRIITEEE